jgi:hypothetical protein
LIDVQQAHLRLYLLCGWGLQAVMVFDDGQKNDITIFFSLFFLQLQKRALHLLKINTVKYFNWIKNGSSGAQGTAEGRGKNRYFEGSLGNRQQRRVEGGFFAQDR